MNQPTGPGHITIGAQSNDHSAHLAGVSTQRFFTHAPTFAQVQVLVSEYYGFDTPINFWDVYNVEAEALGQKVIYHPGGIPDVDRSTPLIQSPADLDGLRPPDPHTSGRMPWVIQANKIIHEMTGALDRVYFTSPFSLAVNVMGYENLVYQMVDSPGFVHRLFEFLCDEVIAPFGQAMRSEIGDPDLILDGRDAWASPPMITLDMVDEYVVAYTQRLRENLGPALLTRGNWGDAQTDDPERFFAQKLKCSPGVLSVLDPDLYQLGPAMVKAFADEHDVPVAAGVDAKLIRTGPVEAIVERIKLYLDHLARDGRAVIHLNHIPAETPPEHVHAAVAACHAYGRLPMEPDLDDVDFKLSDKGSFEEFLEDKGVSIDT